MALVALAVALTCPLAHGQENLDFEEGVPGGAPIGWMVPEAVHAAGYEATLTDASPASGVMAAELRYVGEGDPEGFGNLMQTVDAAPWRGHRVGISAKIRVKGGRGQLWMRVDLPDGEMGFFDNSNDRPVTSDDWTELKIVGVVDEDAEDINFGLLYIGDGRAWIDGLQIEDLGLVGETETAAVSARGMENLVALARLAGIVECFHPTDQARATDWTRLVADAALTSEAALDAEALAAALQAAFAPIAPTVQVWAGPPEEAPPAELPDARRAMWVEHLGIGSSWQGVGLPSNIYESEVRNGRTVQAEDRLAATTVALGGGVSARIPLVLPADRSGSLPRLEAPPPLVERPDWWVPEVSDRSVRLAATMRTWNVFQHFYPYWDVVDADWPAALREGLAGAAEAPDAETFHWVLSQMVARARDGHGAVHTGGASHQLPVELAWVEGEVVVLRTLSEASALAPGDVLLEIDGAPIDAALAEALSGISAAGDGWLYFRAMNELAERDSSAPVELRVRRFGEGEELVVQATPLTVKAAAEVLETELGPVDGAEVGDGIYYFDLDGADMEELEPFLKTLADARGVIFDLRGYPGSAGSQLLGYLSDDWLRSAIWKSPIYTLPDQEAVTWDLSGRWRLRPRRPRLTENVVFITDGRAISYAESCLGIIEHYELGEIVGAPSAGTNGNINLFQPLPGVNVVWTGMRVVKHDGSEHHGVGVLPTVPVEPTLAGVAQGRDELLERALEVAEAAAE
ncbi:MAG TPA: S41 family peptidase [Myxococcota bacterium]|nr:S41 family peptidase [Myxococcota bacterium]